MESIIGLRLLHVRHMFLKWLARAARGQSDSPYCREKQHYNFEYPAINYSMFKEGLDHSSSITTYS